PVRPGHRLLAVDVFSGPQRGDRHGCVEIVVQADVDGLDVVPLQKLTEIRVHVGNVVSLRHAASLRLVHVRDGDNLRFGDSGVLLEVMLSVFSYYVVADPDSSLPQLSLPPISLTT